jgi:hypothetical protein
MLILSPKNRISMAAILKHPWMMEKSICKSRKEREEMRKILSEENIISMIESYGFDKEYINICLAKEYYSHVNACYYLLKNL